MFALDLTGINNNFKDYLSTKIGIQLRRVSDGSIINEVSVNTELFPFSRTAYASITTPSGIDFYVTCYVRFTVVAPALISLAVCCPRLNSSLLPMKYEPSQSGFLKKEPLNWRFDAKEIPRGIRTLLSVTSASIQNSIGRFDGNGFHARQTGLYSFDIINICDNGSDINGARLFTSLQLNDSGFINETEDTAIGFRAVWKHSSKLWLNAGDKINVSLYQFSLNPITTKGGSYCRFDAAFLGGE